MTQIKPIDISVLIPVFNGIKYIQRGLDAICNQSLKSIEIIVVDDGSTDGSSAFLDEYAQKDSRITIIHQQNAGAGRARNVAMDHAHGEFFYFFDIDDMGGHLRCWKLHVQQYANIRRNWPFSVLGSQTVWLQKT